MKTHCPIWLLFQGSEAVWMAPTELLNPEMVDVTAKIAFSGKSRMPAWGGGWEGKRSPSLTIPQFDRA